MSTSATDSPSLSRRPAEKSPPLAHLAISELPSEPLTTIEPSKRWSIFNFGELWAYRELLYFLTWRDLKVRYKQTLLGVTWVVMQPLLMTVVFTIFLGKLVQVPSDNMPYAVFVLAGMLPWIFISASVVGSSNSLVGSGHLITKVYFPRVIIPAAVICGRLVDLLVSSIIFGVVLAVYRVPINRQLLLLPFIALLMALLALAIGMWASAVNVKYRDVSALLPFFVQFWMFISPVVYPSSLVQAQNIAPIWRWLYTMNPTVGIIENFRAAVLGTPINWPTLATATIITVILLVYACHAFRRLETSFADII